MNPLYLFPSEYACPLVAQKGTGRGVQRPTVSWFEDTVREICTKHTRLSLGNKLKMEMCDANLRLSTTGTRDLGAWEHPMRRMEEFTPLWAIGSGCNHLCGIVSFILKLKIEMNGSLHTSLQTTFCLKVDLSKCSKVHMLACLEIHCTSWECRLRLDCEQGAV